MMKRIMMVMRTMVTMTLMMMNIYPTKERKPVVVLEIAMPFTPGLLCVLQRVAFISGK